MKKTLIISNVFWVLLFSVFLFKNCTPDTPVCESISKSYEKDRFVGFPIETAREMTQHYRTNKGASKLSVLESEDTRSVWFSLDSLKKFIWNVEKATCETKSGELSDLGVRIYFSRYPEAERIKVLKGFEKISDEDAKALANKLSLYFVPTLKENGVNNDYDAIRKWRLQREGSNGKTTPKAMYFVQPDPPFESAFNHATLCPVACSGTN